MDNVLVFKHANLQVYVEIIAFSLILAFIFAVLKPTITKLLWSFVIRTKCFPQKCRHFKEFYFYNISTQVIENLMVQ